MMKNVITLLFSLTLIISVYSCKEKELEKMFIQRSLEKEALIDEEALERQLNELSLEERKELPFHKALLKGKLPLTIGGGIGQCRVAIFVTKEKEISVVQPVFQAY